MTQEIPSRLFYTAFAIIMIASFFVFSLYTRRKAESPEGYATIDLLQV